jgi:Cu/Ag efflux pump CusA
VDGPIFFAMAIIILAFVPVFALTGQEGKLFHPLAFTKTFAMIGSTLLAVTLVPVLCSLLVRGPFHAEESNIVMKFLLRLYEPTLNWALNHRKTVIAAAMCILAVALADRVWPATLNREKASAMQAIPSQSPMPSPALAKSSCRRSMKAACSTCR